MNKLIQKRNFFKFVEPNTTAVVQRFGEVVRERTAGLMFYIPLVEKVNIMINTRVQIVHTVDTKTMDDVSVKLEVGLKWFVKPENSSKALFSFHSGEEKLNQIHSIISHNVRSLVQTKTLDQLYLSRHDFENIPEIKDFLMISGRTYLGLELMCIDPDHKVVESMNKINASKRLLEASRNDAESNYVKVVRDAEAQRDAEDLRGQGVAKFRDRILCGWSDDIMKISEKLNLPPTEMLEYVLRQQNLDVVNNISTSSNAKVVFLDRVEKGKESIKAFQMHN